MILHGGGRLVFFAVPPRAETCVTVTPEDRSVTTTGTLPGVADRVQDEAPQISARLLRAYAADDDVMRGHAA